MDYTKVVEYILEIPMYSKKTSKENTKILLERLGNPEKDKKIVHVAGTNGKGSVCSYIGSVLEEAGKLVGMFTSPHLVYINERIQINRVAISNEEFVSIFEKVYSVSKKMEEDGYLHPAFFEFLFAMAMEAFARRGVDYIILETGLGGRLDATNTIEHPSMTVITSVGLDHTEVLGDSLEKIALEKAGIIKAGVPVVYWGQEKEVSKVIEGVALEKGSASYRIHQNSFEILKITNKNIDFSTYNRYDRICKLSIPFSGIYQVSNAVLAINAIYHLDESIDDEVIKRGILKARWAGRMEEVLPSTIIDGAHNLDGVRAFISSALQRKVDGKTYLLFSVVKEKDYEHMIQMLCENIDFDNIVLTEIEGRRNLPVSDIEKVFREYTEKKIYSFKDIEEAFDMGQSLLKEGDILYCVGSLYLVGKIKELIVRKEEG